MNWFSLLCPPACPTGSKARHTPREAVLFGAWLSLLSFTEVFGRSTSLFSSHELNVMIGFAFLAFVFLPRLLALELAALGVVEYARTLWPSVAHAYPPGRDTQALKVFPYLFYSLLVLPSP